MEFENYTVEKIDEASWRIEEGFVRTYLFAGTERALLVDTGLGSGDIAAVVRSLTGLPLMLVNTHADGDHIGGNGQFENTYMHPAEFAYYEKSCKVGDAAPQPLQDGELIELGDRSFEVILLPGHTCGSIALLERETGVLVGGDSVASSPVFLFGETRSAAAYKASLERLLVRLEEISAVYPSHGVFPQEKEQIARQLSCLEKLQRGELTPQEPLMPVPAKMYCADGAGYYYIP